MHIAQWQQFHGPLIAFAVALGLALAGRFLRIGSLAAAAGGAGVVAGWYAVAGRLWTTSPLPSVEALTELAIVLLLISLLCNWLGPGRQLQGSPPGRGLRPRGRSRPIWFFP